MGTEIGDLDAEGAYASDSAPMILTCPSCATRYFVDDERIGAAGRTVRCASCGERWMARPEVDLELSHSPEEGAVGHEPIQRASLEATPPPTQDLPAEELPKVFRERAQIRRKVREAATAGVVWAALAGVFVVIAGLSLLMRQDIAQIWPKTAGAYAMIGLPVNLVGLAIEDQHARPALKDGHAAVIVTGVLRNVRNKAIAAPELRVSLLNPAGRVMAVKIADPGGALIPPGEARHFVVDLLDPPVSATDVEVAFLLDGPRRRAAPPAGVPAPAKLSLRGAAGADLTPALPEGPVVAPPADAPDVKPLPASSPYALPRDHARTDDPHG
jgi:predicted Zn finger-like uncharacterized protein